MRALLDLQPEEVPNERPLCEKRSEAARHIPSLALSDFFFPLAQAPPSLI